MDESEFKPLMIVLLYVLRCGVPLALMLGLSYLLRRFGLIRESPPPPREWNNNQANGGLAHGKP